MCCSSHKLWRPNLQTVTTILSMLCFARDGNPPTNYRTIAGWCWISKAVTRMPASLPVSRPHSVKVATPSIEDKVC
jgi:hypothetical protein